MPTSATLDKHQTNIGSTSVFAPNKQETLIQWCIDVATLAQHQSSIGSTTRICWDAGDVPIIETLIQCCLVLFNPVRRWPNTNTALDQLLVLAGVHRSKHETLNQCLVNVGLASATLGQHQSNIGSTSHVLRCTCLSAYLEYIWPVGWCCGRSLGGPVRDSVCMNYTGVWQACMPLTLTHAPLVYIPAEDATCSIHGRPAGWLSPGSQSPHGSTEAQLNFNPPTSQPGAILNTGCFHNVLPARKTG